MSRWLDLPLTMHGAKFLAIGYKGGTSLILLAPLMANMCEATPLPTLQSQGMNITTRAISSASYCVLWSVLTTSSSRFTYLGMTQYQMPKFITTVTKTHTHWHARCSIRPCLCWRFRLKNISDEAIQHKEPSQWKANLQIQIVMGKWVVENAFSILEKGFQLLFCFYCEYWWNLGWVGWVSQSHSKSGHIDYKFLLTAHRERYWSTHHTLQLRYFSNVKQLFTLEEPAHISF